MPLFAYCAIPGVVAIRHIRNRMDLVLVCALGTIPMRFATAVGDLVPVFAIGAIPGMRAEFFFRRIIIRFPTAVFFAVPVTPRARFVKSMPSVARFAVPAVSAVRIGFGRMMRRIVRAPPVMRTTRVLSVNSRRRILSETSVTEPIIARARIPRRMMRFCAPRTRPIMVAAVILQQDIFAR